MDSGTSALLGAAGIIGGALNAIAGGATLITFPAMVAAGLPLTIANASNAMAVAPGHLTAAMADRGRLPARDIHLLADMLAAMAGGAAGAVLLMVTPEHLFTALVPALIAIATLMFALGGRLREALAQRSGGHHVFVRPVLLLLTSVYGGYFGAGLGVMILAVLTVTGSSDIRAANALKNLLATAVSLVTLAVFITQGLVRWPETLVMLAGALAGGVIGSRLITILPQHVVRGAIITIGILMTAIYALRYWR